MEIVIAIGLIYFVVRVTREYRRQRSKPPKFTYLSYPPAKLRSPQRDGGYMSRDKPVTQLPVVGSPSPSPTSKSTISVDKKGRR